MADNKGLWAARICSIRLTSGNVTTLTHFAALFLNAPYHGKL